MNVLRLGDGAGIGSAMRGAWLTMRSRPEVVVASVAGGPASLVPFTPVVTILAGRPSTGSNRVVRWLERRQARRSQLVYATDRSTAVAFALRWRLDLARIRITSGTVEPGPAELGHDLRALHKRRSWHSA